MRLIKLTLRNFKGLRDFSFAPGGESATVYGDNATGKTTLFDAMTWLLFDKDSRGRSSSNFSIKTCEDGETIRQAEHEVQGEFTLDGQPLILRKVYKEKWVTRRGSSEPQFDGHTTDYFVDHVPVQKKEYDERISGIMSEDMFRILTNPLYFPEELHWSDRRKVLMDMCGEVNEEDIIEGGEAILSRYPDVLDGKSQADREKMLKARKKKLTEQLSGIPDRIDENRRMIEEVDGVADARASIEELKKKKQTIEAKRSELKSGGLVAKLNVQRAELTAEYKEKENAHKQKVADALSKQRDKVAEIEGKVDEIEQEFREAKREYQAAASEHQDISEKLDQAEITLHQIKAQQPKTEDEFEPEKCPVCERPMEDGDHNYAGYVEEFNAKKADDRKAAAEKVDRLKEESAETLEKVNKLEQKATNIKGKLNQRREALRKAQKELRLQKADQPDFQDEDIEQELEQIDEKIANHRTQKAEQIKEMEGHIEQIESKIEGHQSLISKAEGNARRQQRIKELQEEQKECAKQLEQVEEGLHIIDRFRMAESRHISRSVNDLFEMVQWKLFEEQVNGGINDQLCEATVGGIPFTGGLNDGARIQAGLDIIRTLSRYYGKQAPVFVDGAESVTSLPETDLQVIRLIVSADYDELTVRTKPEKELATATKQG